MPSIDKIQLKKSHLELNLIHTWQGYWKVQHISTRGNGKTHIWFDEKKNKYFQVKKNDRK